MFPHKNQSRLVKELNLKFDSIIAEFKKEKEALIDNNTKLHARVKELENKYLDDHDRICHLEDSIGDLKIATEDIGYQSEENDARIAKLEQTQKSYN
ncbi:13329_t:CDS:1, partial [Entrophospora sp. SA101]